MQHWSPFPQLRSLTKSSAWKQNECMVPIHQSMSAFRIVEPSVKL